jgi:ATP-binding cassette subfamily A (ABC1) protein 3
MSTQTKTEVSYHLKSKEPGAVQDVLQLLEDERRAFGIASYDVRGSSIEDIFLSLMSAEDAPPTTSEKSITPDTPKPSSPDLASKGGSTASLPSLLNPATQLTTGRRMSPFSQALTIFHKRRLIARRAWLAPLLALLVAVAGACVPLVFLAGRREQGCARRFGTVKPLSLYAPTSPIVLGAATWTSQGSAVYEAPPGTLHALGASAANLSTSPLADNATFVDTINGSYRNLSLGGVSFGAGTGPALFAWEASSPGSTGPTMLNLVSNVLYNRALNASGRATAGGAPRLITPSYQSFPWPAAGTLVALKWVAFFGAAMVRIFLEKVG